MRHVQDELLIAYIEGDVDEEQRRQIEEHLQVCQVCRENYRVYLSIVEELESMPLLPAPAELDRRIKSAYNSPVPLLGAFGFAFLVAMGVVLLWVWGPEVIRWILYRINMDSIISLMVRILGLMVRFYTISLSSVKPGFVVGGMVILSILLAVILRRRLENYAGSAG